jgi:hypothetical protein
MAEKMVRCVRCHEVFDAEAGPCTKCGTPYRPPVAQPKAIDGLYVERYAGTPYVPEPPPAPVVPARRRSSTPLLLGGGATLIAIAVVVAILAATGMLGGGPTAAPAPLIARTEPPSPTPTLPPSISMTLAQLNDPRLGAHVAVDSRAQFNGRVFGQSKTDIVTFDGQISAGNESGTLQTGGAKMELRLVDGVLYTRNLPSGKWSVAASIPSYLIIAPLFGITSPKMLALVGQETRNGQTVNHLRTTPWWAPDLSRVALMDLSTLRLAPDSNVLDLWATIDGTPVSATFSGTNSASDGTKLLDIEVSYTFTDVGVPVDIVSPLPTPSPS